MMADFSFLSDSDDEKAVQELLSQAMDHSVLEQVAAINCSGFDPDSVLPTHLESRFRKLKSLPATATAKPNNFSTATHHNRSASSSLTLNKSLDKPQLNPVVGKSEPESKGPRDENAPLSTWKHDPGSGHGSSPSNVSDSSDENAIFSPAKRHPDRKRGPKNSNSKSRSKSKSGSFRSPSESSLSSSSGYRSPSPERAGCLWCSPKTITREKKKSKANRELLSDLSNLSMKRQEKMLRKAMKQEEKLNHEAEKIVKWAKQASARFDVDLSDHEKSTK